MSDFHFKNDDDCSKKLDERKKSLVNSITSNSVGYDYCIIALTGDITFSCNNDDYAFAYDYLKEIKESVKKFYKKVYIYSVPGNHDCLISDKTSSVRGALIDNMKQKKEYDIEIAKAITEVQSNYFDNFDNKIASGNWIDRMICNEEITFESNSVNIIGLNTAWLSRIKDKKDYYYPTELIPDKSTSDFVITLMHHPFHWYDDSCFHKMKSKIELISNIIFTGHDHTAKASGIVSNEANYSFFNGGIFYKEGSPLSTFTIYSIDFKRSLISGNEFSLKDGLYHSNEIFSEKELLLNNNKKNILMFSQDYLNKIFDIGLNISHSHKENLMVEDIFVWPSVNTLEISKSNSEKLVQNIISHIKTEKKIVFAGQESIGKTTMAKMIINDLYKDNIYAIMPDFTEVTEFSEKVIRKIIDSQIERQFGKDKEDLFFSGTSITRRCIIIDDLHLINMNEKSMDSFINMLEDLFGFVLLFINSSTDYFYFEPTYVRVMEYNLCEINEFSNEQINEIVEKWILAGRETEISDKEFVRESDSAFKTIYSLMGTKNIMSRNPLNILLILNQWQVNENFDTSKSAYAELCSSLINLNMQKLCGGNNNQIKKLDAILTKLSSYLYFNKNKVNDFSYDDFNEVCDEYKKDKFILQNNDDAMSLLIAGKFLSINNGGYKFRDKSVMYHYMAKYLSQNLSSQKEIIKHMVNHAYSEYNANILLFLSSVSNEKYILDCLLEKVNEFLQMEEEFDFNNEEFKKRNQELTALSLTDDISPKEARRESVKKLDNKKQNATYEDDEVKDDDINDLMSINCIVRCIQIVGQLVKNGFHNMNGYEKVNIIDNCYSLSLRTVRMILKSIDATSDEICNKMYQNVQENEAKSFEEYKIMFDEFTIHIKKKITLNILMHTSHSTGSSELKLVYNELRKKNESLGYRFLGIITDVCILNKVDESILVKFYNDLKERKLIFVCDMMRIVVRTYLYLNDCDYRKRQRICASLEIAYEPKRLLIDKKTRI